MLCTCCSVKRSLTLQHLILTLAADVFILPFLFFCLFHANSNHNSDGYLSKLQSLCALFALCASNMKTDKNRRCCKLKQLQHVLKMWWLHCYIYLFVHAQLYKPVFFPSALELLVNLHCEHERRGHDSWRCTSQNTWDWLSTVVLFSGALQTPQSSLLAGSFTASLALVLNMLVIILTDLKKQKNMVVCKPSTCSMPCVCLSGHQSLRRFKKEAHCDTVFVTSFKM